MEALAAISLVSNIIQFVEVGSKVIAGAKEIYTSKDGMTKDNKSLEDATHELRKLSHDLRPTSKAAHSEDERILQRLSGECRDVFEQLLALIKSTVPRNPQSKFASLSASVKHAMSRSERKDLKRKLDDCRSQLHLSMDRVARCV